MGHHLWKAKTSYHLFWFILDRSARAGKPRERPITAAFAFTCRHEGFVERSAVSCSLLGLTDIVPCLTLSRRQENPDQRMSIRSLPLCEWKVGLILWEKDAKIVRRVNSLLPFYAIQTS
jgi:hypothetical protein